VSVRVANDTTAPTVAVLSPAGGATVTGAIAFSVGASDDVGVAGVQVTLDGVNLGAEHTAAPYEWSWIAGRCRTGARADGDGARCGGQSAERERECHRRQRHHGADSRRRGPSAETTVAGTITFSMDASDDVGVVAIQVAVDGVPIGPEQTSARTSGAGTARRCRTARTC